MSSRTLPRLNGMLLLHNEQTLQKLALPNDDEKLTRITSELTDCFEAAKTMFFVVTGHELTIVPKGNGYAWLVPDCAAASAQYRWLKSKALRIEGQIVTRLNAKWK